MTGKEQSWQNRSAVQALPAPEEGTQSRGGHTGRAGLGGHFRGSLLWIIAGVCQRHRREVGRGRRASGQAAQHQKQEPGEQPAARCQTTCYQPGRILRWLCFSMIHDATGRATLPAASATGGPGSQKAEVEVFTSRNSHSRHFSPLSRARRKSRFLWSSFMNSSFCRKSAIRSSSRYCFHRRSCSREP